MVCHTSLDKRDNTDERWTATFEYGKERERERLGKLVSAKPPQLAPLRGRVALIPKQSDLGFFHP